MIIDKNNTAHQNKQKSKYIEDLNLKTQKTFPTSTLASKLNEIGLSKNHCTFSTQDLSW